MTVIIDDWLQWCYSNHPLIVLPKTSLGSSREVAQGCWVSFVIYLYLVPLIISQNLCTTCAATNQTEPESCPYTAVLHCPVQGRSTRTQFNTTKFSLQNFIIIQMKDHSQVRYNSTADGTFFCPWTTPMKLLVISLLVLGYFKPRWVTLIPSTLYNLRLKIEFFYPQSVQR